MAPNPFGITSLLGQVKPVMQSLETAGIGSPVDLTGLDERAAKLRSFLGSTDYSAQNKEATDFAKLQFALSLMGRGFAAMGATPKRGESALGTLGRTMIAPIAGDISTIAGPLMKQRAATRLAKRQEERQLRLAALNQAQAEKKAREGYAMGLLTKAAGKLGTNDFTTNKVENVQATIKIEGQVVTIPAANLSVQVDKKDPTNQIITTIGQTTLQDGTVVPAGHKVLGYKKRPEAPDTTVERGLFGQVYDKKSGGFRTLNQVTRMQDIVEGAAGESSTLKDRYFIQEPNGKMVPVNGFVVNRPSHGPFSPSDPLYIVDAKKVALALGVPEDSVRPNDIIKTFRRPAIIKTGATEDIIQRRFKGLVVENKLTDELILSAAVQTKPLAATQQVKAGLELESRAAFVNTSKRTLNVGGQTIGPNQTGYFSKTDMNSPAFLNVSDSFREIGPVSTDAVTYMFKEPKTITVGDQTVEYTPGDDIRYTPQEFANLPKDLQKILTDDTALRATTLKKNYFTSIWKDVIKREGLPSRDIKTDDLQTLLGIFPAGSRAGQRLLRDEIFKMIKLGATANPDTAVSPATAAAYAAKETYAQSVASQLADAEERYSEYLRKDVIPYVPWQSLSFEKKRAFADMRKVVQITNANLLWQKAQDRLAKDKASFKPMSHDDVASFGSAAELLILAKHLRDGQELDKTGRFFVGTLSKLGAGIFADVEPLTSGASRRLQQIINRMKASYATLSATEGGGRDTVFRQQLQAALVPEFNKAESMNRANLDSMINRLETNMRSVFNKETQSTNTIPKIFEIMAKDAGITGVSVDQKRYRWLDPNEKEKPPVTRQRVMDSINMVPYSIDDAQDLRAGRLLPPAPDLPDKRFVKIKNLDNGEVLIQRARNDGKPDTEFRPIVMFVDPESKQIRTRNQNGR